WSTSIGSGIKDSGQGTGSKRPWARRRRARTGRRSKPARRRSPAQRWPVSKPVRCQNRERKRQGIQGDRVISKRLFGPDASALGTAFRFSMAELFIQRAITTTLIMAGIVLFGLIGYRALPVSGLPNVDYPTIQVTAELPGASPETMASSVATPLE